MFVETPQRRRFGKNAPSLFNRFWGCADRREDGCWQWSGPRITGGGYGLISVNGRMVRAHRFAYELLVGPIPDGLTIDHLCRNTLCVNPDHLEPVTRAENSRRAGPPPNPHTHITHCKRGHEFTPENTRHYAGRRHCRACAADWARRARAEGRI